MGREDKVVDIPGRTIDIDISTVILGKGSRCPGNLPREVSTQKSPNGSIRANRPAVSAGHSVLDIPATRLGSLSLYTWFLTESIVL